MATNKRKYLDAEYLRLCRGDPNRFAIVVSDIDYTLMDFDAAHKAGMAALSKQFGEPFADEISEMFHLTVEGHRKTEGTIWEKRQAFDTLLDRVKQLQAPFLDSYGIKAWSREAWILIAAEKLGMPFTSKQVEEGRDAYWQAASNNSVLYEDAREFLGILQRLSIPLILMTSSDSICHIREDGLLLYDPARSEQYKRERLEQLPFRHEDLLIGDPIDKPDPRFFDKVFQAIARLGNFHREKILVIGDSERNDLQEPRQRGYSTLLVERD